MRFGSRRSKESSKSRESMFDETDTLESDVILEERGSPKDVFAVPDGLSPSSVVSKDGQRVITAHDGGFFPPSALRESVSFDPTLKKNVPLPSERSTVALKSAPSAREAAYSGPPRYDWIDVETAAVLKIQAIYRRNKVITALENEGKLTAGMRNRRRARANRMRDGAISDDVPTCMKFCGVGYLFGDMEEESQELMKEKRTAAYEEKKRQKQIKEEQARRYRFRNRPSEELCEGYEVVDNTSRRSNHN